MSIIFKKYLTDKRLWVIFAGAVVRMGWLGFRYYPLLDDYIQYGLYSILNNPFLNAFIKTGSYAYRPLAGLFDIYIWGKLWSNMGIAFIILTLLHSLSAYLFIVSAEKINISLGLCFAVVFVLCPINFEGSYWISASSRLIVGTFLVSVSCFMLVTNRIKLFFVIQLFSMLFYEQVIILSIVISTFIIIYKKSYKLVGLTIINIAIVGFYYIVFSKMGSYGRRSVLKIINFDAVRDVIMSWNISWFAEGIIRGFKIAGVWYLIAIIFISACFIQKRGDFKIELVALGVIIFITSYIPIVILQNYTVGLRNCFVPLIGVAIVVDSLLNLTSFKPVITCILVSGFMLISVGELVDYKANYNIDNKLIAYVSENMNFNENNVIEGAQRRYINSNIDFAEHILSITSSDWALTGAVRGKIKNSNIPLVYLNKGNLVDYNLICVSNVIHR